MQPWPEAGRLQAAAAARVTSPPSAEEQAAHHRAQVCCSPLSRRAPFAPCRLQNPKERITLPKMMKHPWVTRRGSWPLRSMKEMVRSGEDLDEQAEVPDLMNTFHVLDVPRQVSQQCLSGSAQSKVCEVALRPSDVGAARLG